MALYISTWTQNTAMQFFFPFVKIVLWKESRATEIVFF